MPLGQKICVLLKTPAGAISLLAETVTDAADDPDAETGDLQVQLTDGQREYDIDLARTNIIGELMDLASGRRRRGEHR